MRKLIAILSIVTIILACSDVKKNDLKNSSELIQTKTGTFLSAKVNGVEFYSDNPNYSKFDNVINLYGYNKGITERILFHIVYDNGPSTYNVGKAINKKGNMIYTQNKIHWIASKHRGKGTITLIEKGNYLLGEFSFSAKENNITKQITDGKFKVKMKK